MLNLKILENLRTKEEVKEYLISLGYNADEETIDNYLNRSDSVYIDMRMLKDPGDYEAIGGDSYLSGFVKGFEVIPYPYLVNVTGLPEEVGDTYDGDTLFTEEDGKYTVTVTEKEVVRNSDYKEGYYIAETNVVEDFGLGGYAKLVYADENGENIIGDADGYIADHNGEPDNLYTVYQMNGTVELMLPVDPADVEVTN